MFRLITRRSTPIVIELLSKPNCCLCDQIEFSLQRMINANSTRFRNHTVLKKINIENDPDLYDEYQFDVPAVRIGDVLFKADPKIDIRKISEHVIKLVGKKYQ